MCEKLLALRGRSAADTPRAAASQAYSPILLRRPSYASAPWHRQYVVAFPFFIPKMRKIATADAAIRGQCESDNVLVSCRLQELCTTEQTSPKARHTVITAIQAPGRGLRA